MTAVDSIRPSADEVHSSVSRARTHLEQAAEEVVWQVASRAWESLGYIDWDQMREEEYGGIAVIVPRADRPELVAKLRGEGLTQQAIADTLGVSHQTVGRDLNVQMDNEAAEQAVVTNARGQQRPASYAPRPEPNTAKVTETTKTETYVDTTTGEVVDTPEPTRIHLGDTMNDKTTWPVDPDAPLYAAADDWSDTFAESILDGTYADACRTWGMRGSARFVALLGGAA